MSNPNNNDEKEDSIKKETEFRSRDVPKGSRIMNQGWLNSK